MSVVYNHIYLITAYFTGLRSGLRQFNLSEDNMTCGSRLYLARTVQRSNKPLCAKFMVFSRLTLMES